MELNSQDQVLKTKLQHRQPKYCVSDVRVDFLHTLYVTYSIHKQQNMSNTNNKQ